ncbi:MAG TPA: dihydropteroate synthase [Devosiaceae bacterium]
MRTHDEYLIRLRTGAIRLGREPVVMGIVNVTPDSFSDGGDSLDPQLAVRHALDMANEGAAIVDIGGESTRPGADEVPVQSELDRIMPVLAALRDANLSAPISIDTYKALVADQAIQAGAQIVNDVHGAQRDPEIADVAALYDLPLIAMHWDTERDPSCDIIDEMKRYFARTIAIADRAGLKRSQLILDPGFGFAKTFEENYEILRRLDELQALGFPLVVGTSRKSMLGKLLDIPPKERIFATVATSVIGYLAGAHIFRVHDVRANRDALRVAAATVYGPAVEPSNQ